MARIVAIVALILLLQGCAATMLRTTCDKPRISNFGAPTSHVIVLPHGYAGQDPVHQQAAHELNQLARLQALQAAVSMPLSQITFVEGGVDDPNCDIEEVYDRVVEGRTKYFWRKAYHSAVFVWGEVFPDEHGLQVQSQLRVFWNGDLARKLRLERHRKGLVFTFQGSLPSETIALPIFTVSEVDLARIKQALSRTFEKIDERPPLGEACTGLPPRFSVESWRAPWLEIVRRSGQSCWLRLDPVALESQFALLHVLLGRAVAAYLSHRVRPDATADRAMRNALAALRLHLGKRGHVAAGTAMAWAEIMEATSNWTPQGAVAPAWTQGEGLPSFELDVKERARAASSLQLAARLLPTSAEALNLAALGALQLCCDEAQAEAQIQKVHSFLHEAHQLDPSNVDVLANLVTWHRLLKELPASRLPFPAAELDFRLNQAIAARTAWRGFSAR